MNENGRKTDVLIEDVFYTDPKTGVEMMLDYFQVWADAGLNSLIESVEGVTSVCTPFAKTCYSVRYDKRYDRDFIKREVEAAIICK